MHEITAKETKRNSAPSNRDDDLTYATSSSEAGRESSEHERASIGHGNETSSGDFRATDYANRVQ